MKNPVPFRRKARKVLVITLCWTLLVTLSYISNYYFVTDLVRLGKLQGTYAFWPDFTAQAILGVFGGLVGGYLLVFRMDKRYKKRSFAFGIINSGLSFILFYLAIAIAGLFFLALAYFSLQESVREAAQRSWHNVIVNLNTPSFIWTMAFAALLVSGTQFMLQVNDKFGSGVLWKFITGKYYLPRQEERIFMFLDLKSSTTIAEKIGSRHFFELLREIFRDITEPIIDSLGEIYQYVGDEVIITWTVDNGMKDNNCLDCFFRIEKLIEEKSAYYLKQYGHVPFFKAGLHLGEATVGEIGIIKKDIVFSGDVLNTAARIQGECNHYQVGLLASSELMQHLHIDGAYQKVHMGEIRLRGKENMVALNSVTISKGHKMAL
ncbi:MAG: adenylate/guanylate cyclase domain-containing protein [Phaeodactylibacter sp.]|nr:adenylate/guanylate cyclase domain-containing protein [Phaeodactylibacter sp.]MCB9276848.1 adenylate/guanylate cyclase domain-containing protein [Lewinellaceae bacterium]